MVTFENDPFLVELDRITNEFCEDVGVIKIKTANKTINDVKNQPTPEKLFYNFWFEGEVCCLFSDSNLGKSILAVQIADEITKNMHDTNVLYFDFEMSDKQFQLRYTTDTGILYHFADNLRRACFNREKYHKLSEEELLKNIEDAAIETDSKVIIIDNLTYLCAESEKGVDAANLMTRLNTLKIKYDWSLLVVAHTPKRDMSRPITANDLAGSRKLFNFFDSVFAIGRSFKDEGLRYIKHLKCRLGEFIFSSENVLVSTIEKKEDGFLGFVPQGTSTEDEHLKSPTDKDKEELKARIYALANQGMTYRAIAKELFVSKSLIGKVLTGKR